MSHSLADRVALVTGGGRGVGQGIALALAREGARVGINYSRSRDAAEETAAEIRRLGGDAVTIRADVSVSADVSAMIREVVERLGALDVLVNNAGVQTWSPLLEVTEADWDRVIDVNLKGCFLCTQAAARSMRDYGGGAIVNIGSGSNKMPFPNLAAYTASKGGIELLTRVAAVELGPLGIRVNCVAPGAIEIERTRQELPDYAATWGRITPLRRIGTPDDVGSAVVFLASPDASFVNGQTLWVDGALFSQAPWASAGPAAE
jgi:NAD(P)-dependent dehydrogenase (short-subunit alcohol dehydrogenase family)